MDQPELSSNENIVLIALEEKPERIRDLINDWTKTKILKR